MWLNLVVMELVCRAKSPPVAEYYVNRNMITFDSLVTMFGPCGGI
jgi:hypothetical protein